MEKKKYQVRTSTHISWFLLLHKNHLSNHFVSVEYLILNIQGAICAVWHNQIRAFTRRTVTHKQTVFGAPLCQRVEKQGPRLYTVYSLILCPYLGSRGLGMRPRVTEGATHPWEVRTGFTAEAPGVKQAKSHRSWDFCPRRKGSMTKPVWETNLTVFSLRNTQAN